MKHLKMTNLETSLFLNQNAQIAAALAASQTKKKSFAKYFQTFVGWWTRIIKKIPSKIFLFSSFARRYFVKTKMTILESTSEVLKKW